MYTYKNLAEVLKQREYTQDKGIRFIYGENEDLYLPYKDLYKKALEYLKKLQVRGVQPGQELVFQIEENYQFICVFWACILGGIIPIPISIGNNYEHKIKIFRIIDILNHPYLISDRKSLVKIKQFAEEDSNLHQKYKHIEDRYISLEDMEGEEGFGVIHESLPDDIAFIQFSSGSTGDPKGVMLTHENLLTNLQDIVKSGGWKTSESILSWMPLTHDMGLIGCHLTPLLNNMNQSNINTSLFIRNPIIWLHKANELRINILQSPNFGYRYFLTRFKREVAKDWDLSCVRVINNGAEPISLELCKEFEDRMSEFNLPKNTMVPVYGLAEACVAAAFSPRNEEIKYVKLLRNSLEFNSKVVETDCEEDSITFVDLGYPLENCKIRICDDEDVEVEDDTIGIIQIKGRNVTSGYFNNEDATKAVITKDGWLNTGDLGFMRNARLTVTGRRKDIIFVNGQNIYPHDIEKNAERIEGILAGGVGACSAYNRLTQREEICLFVVYKKSLNGFMEFSLEIKKEINIKMGLEIHNVIPVKKIPKTTSGKIQRFAFRKMFENGEYEQLLEELNELAAQAFSQRNIERPATETEAGLCDTFKKVFGISEIGVNDSLFELGGNSLKAAEIASNIYQEFNVHITLSEMFTYPTVRLLAKYIDSTDKTEYLPIETTDPEREYFQLSSSQKRIYLLENMESGTTMYNIPAVMSIEGRIDAAKLEDAFRVLIERHDTLRTAFHRIDDDIFQKIYRDIVFTMALGECSQSEIDSEVQAFIRPFDLESPPLIRAELVKTGENRHYLLLDTHHIISDGMSMNILMKDLSSVYNGKSLPELKYQYRDFAAWQSGAAFRGEIKCKEKYWLEKFSDTVPVLNIPTDYPRPYIKSSQGSRIFFEVNSELTKSLNALAMEAGSTMYMVLLAAFNILLEKYSGQEDIVVGSPAAGRTRSEFSENIGMFVNTLAMRNTPKHDISFKEFLAQVRMNALNAVDNQEYQFEDLIERLNIQRDLSRNPLFDVMFTMQNIEDTAMNMGDLKFKPYNVDCKASKFDLSLDAYVKNGVLSFELEYCTALFRRESIEKMSGHFNNILNCIVKQPEAFLSDLDMLSDAEKILITKGFNSKKAEYDFSKSLYELFEDNVHKTPHKTALIYEDIKLSYEELNIRANRIAAYLRKKGLDEGGLAGVMLERCPLMVEVILGIWKAGGAYIPLDVSYPIERKKGILEDSGAKYLVTLSCYAEKELSGEYDGTLICIDRIENALLNESSEDLKLHTDIHGLAYVLFTSGSTGKPKGVMIEHLGMLNHIFAQRDELKLDNELVFAQNASHCFDISVWQFFAALALGGTTVIYSNDLILEPLKFIDRIQRDRITLLEVVPTYLSSMMDCIEDSKLYSNSLTHLIVTGEAVRTQAVKRWFKLFPQVKLVNAYGPAEASDDVTQLILDSGFCDANSIPIGAPLTNVNVYITDNQMKLCPVGVIGEICISGINVGRGYINNPEKTKEVFLADPFQEEAGRLYKTGDLGKWLPDGNIEFVGRKDYQVKVRGFRIELGEIEAALAGYGEITGAAVTVLEDGNGNNCICAYYSSVNDIKINHIKEHLSKFLPEYMVPQYFMQLESLPLLPSGKIDRAALPKPYPQERQEYSAPANSTEERLQQIWGNILKVDGIGTNDDFFSLGGHSLRAANVAARIFKEFNVQVATRDVFRYPTIKQLAEHIAQSESSSYMAIGPAGEKEYNELSSAQKRLFILDRFENGGIMYNMPGVRIIYGDLDVERLEQSIKKIIKRHEILRSSFHYIDGIPYQKIHDDVDFSISFEERPDAADNLQELIKPFDLQQPPLIRAKVVQTEPYKSYLFLDMHHIVSDGISIDILIGELCGFYNGLEFEPLKLQYKDFAAWQNKFLSGKEMEGRARYWTEKFSGEIPVLNMPTDYARPSVQSFEGDRIYFEAEEDLTRGLKQLAGQTGTTLYMILLASYYLLLSRYTGQEDIVIGSPSAGRGNVELQNMIGMFVNTLALRNAPEQGRPFSEFLLEVKDDVLKANENQDYQFEELVGRLDIKRDISRNPLFDTMFTMQNTENINMKMGGLVIEPCNIGFKVSKFDLSLDAFENEGSIDFEMEYCTALYKKETIERMAAHYVQVLKAIVAGPDVRMSQICLLTSGEKDQIINFSSPGGRNYVFDKTLHRLFEENTDNSPDKTAVIFNDERITYGVLNEKANRLANYLRKMGVCLESLAGVMLERSPLFVEAVMAIWKAGGAYIPLDINYPANRKLGILEDSKSEFVITLSAFTDNEFKNSYHGNIIYLDLIEQELSKEASENPRVDVGNNNLAYVLFTSGSTGKPKGVMIEHKGMLNHIFAERDELSLDDSIIFAQNANQCFDISVWQLFAALALGGTTAIYPNELILETDSFVERIIQDKVTLLEVVPSYLTVMMDTMYNRGLRPEVLKHLIITGEAVKAQTVKRWFELCPGTKVVNAYGPAEASDDVAQLVMDTMPESGHISIGKPLNGINIYIVDRYMNLCPIGVTGELCISGIGVGRGYVNQIEKSREVFVEDPFADQKGVRMYKTGDLAKWLPDGNIEFIGRRDFQVKVRGFRIELGEIESILSGYEGIKDAVVTARQDARGDSCICAYYTSEGRADKAEIKDHIAQFVPEYMIPAYFVQLERLPLSSNGKIDVKALPEPENDKNEGCEPPRNEIEEKLVEVWKNVLGKDDISINDNFFNLGGDSIKAIKVASSLAEQGLKLEVRNLFMHPVISRLGSCVKPITIEAFQGIVEGEVKLTPVQKAFFENNFTDMHHYNQSVMLFSKNGFDETWISQALEKLTLHHDALRMSFGLEKGVVKPFIRGAEGALYSIETFNLCCKGNAENLISEYTDRIQAGIDISKGPLIKAGLFKTIKGDHLLIAVHHLVMDGVSWRILTEDLETAYEQLSGGKEILLPKKTSSYKEWADALTDYAASAELLSESDYWFKIQNAPVTALPKDYGIEEDKYKACMSLSLSLDEKETEDLLLNSNTAYNTEINDLLISALGMCVKKWAGIEAVLINLEGHGRNELFEYLDVNRTIGWFTAEYPVLLDMAKADDLPFTIKSVKETLRRIPNKGLGYGVLKYLSARQNDFKVCSKPEISFNYLGDFDENTHGKKFGISEISPGQDVSPELEREYAIDINCMVIGGRLKVKVEFNKEQFFQTTIESFTKEYINSLRMVIAHCTQKEGTELTPGDVGYSEISLEEFEDLVDEISDMVGGKNEK